MSVGDFGSFIPSDLAERRADIDCRTEIESVHDGLSQGRCQCVSRAQNSNSMCVSARENLMPYCLCALAYIDATVLRQNVKTEPIAIDSNQISSIMDVPGVSSGLCPCQGSFGLNLSITTAESYQLKAHT